MKSIEVILKNNRIYIFSHHILLFGYEGIKN